MIFSAPSLDPTKCNCQCGCRDINPEEHPWKGKNTLRVCPHCWTEIQELTFTELVA